MQGRIIKGVGGLYFVAADGLVYECAARGIFRKKKIIPTIGDNVEISVQSAREKKGTIESIMPRRNCLIRPRVANIDCAVITFAAKSPDINFDLLDRFLVLAEYQKIEDIVICINKSDLSAAEKISGIYSPIYRVFHVSALENDGIKPLGEYLRGKVSVLAGPSGVGKSSIINRLIPGETRMTGEISRKIERGRHTTRQVELLGAGSDTYIVDSPGFTSLSLDLIKPEELQHYFKEFEPYLDGCRFNDCRHIAEPGCVLKEHVGREISRERYERFVKLYEMLSDN
ncbi:MAG: ribosome small subunit-dependent GTPase A [Firmicutes bacterium]|nr:ribosome small subunit-dependent GTPase A [Bacillota bacterium]